MMKKGSQNIEETLWVFVLFLFVCFFEKKELRNGPAGVSKSKFKIQRIIWSFPDLKVLSSQVNSEQK